MKANRGVGDGLEGVVAAETRLSDVDGERGQLVIAGHAVEDLAGSASFERVLALLWSSAGLSYDEASVRSSLGAARVVAFEQLGRLGDALDKTDGMDALRASVAHLEPSADSCARLTGATAVFAAAWSRRREGKAPVAPRPELGHASDFLRMVRGEPADEPRAIAMETYLNGIVDHGMNASTFVARVIASTGSDDVSAIVGAIGALKGPLHGGAPGPVLDMLDAVGKKERATDWIAEELRAGRRIMGMGHRIYRVRDPRAAVFERSVERLERAEEERGGGSAAFTRLEVARAVEREAEAALGAKYPERPLRANVEFYTAVLLEAVGLSRAMFSPTFAVGRVAGWCAHAHEQRRVGRLIRPASRYVGPAPNSASVTRPDT
jgi:citrate synthase